MTIPQLLKRMSSQGRLSAGQADILLRIHERRLFSVHQELRLFLYLGILMIVAGAGLTIKQYSDSLGDLTIVTVLSVSCLAALAYCLLTGSPYDHEEVASPNIAFDYVLFLGCALFAMDIGYSEMKFHLLGDSWKNYLLVSAALFLFLAYRFDNKLVLSLALSTLAAWFGFTLSGYRLSFERYYREYAIAYGCVVLLLGILLYRREIKQHFLDVYLNFAVHFLGIALLAGAVEYRISSFHFWVLLLACAVLAGYALRHRKFLYMLYSVIYAYIGLSIILVAPIVGQTFLVLAYYIVTSLAMICLIFSISRRFKEEG